MIEIAGARRHNEMPMAALTPKKIEAFRAALRTRLTDREGGFSKRYLHEFVSEIRFDGRMVTIQGRKATLLAAAAGRSEPGTATVPSSVHKWLLDLGSNQGPTD